ncbi:hypothetical protein DM01DRAFT_1331283 [Hesseltinella vesiculosa]|uniref:Pre-rRNA-processing protein n=1 Tax=Hesseltinella vesiculosa TaxID=101127 RepID=A0A1X2GYW9_9FUNG|nr:hypothetical protein DM01DRAFT_1331283 [Hesseltinella vesiculosa]
MPNAKKKRAAKQEDFKKKKLKVGKGKALPDNYTDTSFTSKSISLPNQSITEDKSQQITTSRNLTLTDLLSKLKHYSGNVKKDGLSGMQELLGKHPELIVTSLGEIVKGIVKLFIDSDRDVRKALHKFLQETFANIEKVEIVPFVPLLLVYTSSALTHIMEDIRMDGTKLLEIWIDLVPEIVCTNYWQRICDNFASLLAVKANTLQVGSSNATGNMNSSTAVKNAAANTHLHIHKGKLDILTCLSKFLDAGLFEHQQDKFWFMYDYLSDRHDKKAFKRRFNPDNKALTVEWDAPASATYTPASAMTNSYVPYLSDQPLTFSGLRLFESSTGQESTQQQKVQTSMFTLEDRVADVKALIDAYQGMLMGHWLESAPVVFNTSRTITVTPALQMLYTVLRMTLILWRAMVSNGGIENTDNAWLNTHLQQLLKHACIYFPYGMSAVGNPGAKVNGMLQEMNIMTCELTSLWLLARKYQGQDDETLPPWADKIVDYVLGLLGYEVHVDNKETMTTMTSDFRADNLMDLFPAIWGFLNCLEGQDQENMVKAIVGFYAQGHSQSPLTRTSLAFLGRVYLIQSMPSYNGRFVIKKDSVFAEQMAVWAEGLPRRLYELRTAHLDASQVKQEECAWEENSLPFMDALAGPQLAL